MVGQNPGQAASHEGAQRVRPEQRWNVYISGTLESAESHKGKGRCLSTLHLRLFDLINHSSWSEEHSVQLDVEAA